MLIISLCNMLMKICKDPKAKEQKHIKTWTISDEAAVSKSVQNEDRAYKRSQICQERN